MSDLRDAASWLGLLDDDAIALVAGGTTFDRGAEYAEADRVEALDSADRGRVLLATVRGAGRSYQTLVTAVVPTAPVRWVSRCSCPVGGTCKHAVAVLLTARERVAPDAVAADGPAEWERRLAPLLGRPEQAGRSEPDGPAMALVVEVVDAIVQQGTRVPQVRLRPSRTTRTGTWAKSTTWADVVETGYAWNRPPPMHPRHREALTRLHRLSGASTRAYAGRTEVDLAGLGPAGWDALRQVAAAGVELIGAPGPSGVPAPVILLDHPVDVGLDVVRDAAGLLVRARTEGLPAPAADDEVLLVGDPAHGVVVRHGADLVLVPLASPLPNAVAALVLDPRPLRVPTEDADRFVALYLPRLALQVPVASSDGSVEITGPARPVLDVEVVPEPGHRTRLRLGVRYGEVRVRALGRDDPLPRDHGAERRLLDSLDVLDRVPGARTRASERVPWMLTPETVLVGMDAVRFVGEVLPVLQAHPDVHVAVVGELATFEEATEAPVIELATAETDAGGTDWFDLHVTVTVDSEEVPFEPLFAALSRGDTTMLLESGTWFRLDHPSLSGLRDLIEEARGLTDGTREGLRLNRFHIGLWDELVALGVVGEQAARWTASVEAVRGLADAPRPEVPAGLTATLRPYQHDGFHWLSTLWDARLGGVLADDMGLGKTVQVLALLARALEAGELDRPVLVVAPTSVTSTWASEAARFVPGLRTTVVSATSRRRRAPLAELVSGSHVVITSYAVLRIDADEFRTVDWRGLVLDEAQFVKNHQSKTYQAARRVGAPFTLAVTGTPLENSLMDLWSMLSLAAPGLYPRPEVFTEHYRRPIESGSRPDLLDVLRRRIRPLLMRRTKEQVARDLPPKQVQVLSVPMRPEHERLYHQHLQRERQRVLGLLDDPDGNRVAILASLTRLRQMSLHPALVDDAHAGRVASAKLETLVQHLAEVSVEGHRALVFSQFTRFLRMARERLHAEGLTTRYLDGSTRDRQAEIDAFRGGDGDAFLISLKAGGFGLTLTEADYVFVLDPWWNPAAENQAIDRAHRIGQERPVMVYRLVSAGTIEEKVVALQERKRDLFDRVVDDGGALSGPVTADDVRALLEG